ncbi:MAG: DegT/DnrJ/EryC1/StrS family aminotransferase [Chitinophagales bacterium]|nr:DegT/DnrJ/EryC1/StrS family aminotransferase [Chitinophagales bacterium]
MIPVTKTFLPPLEEYNKYLQIAWDRAWITNRGELVKKLETLLQNKLHTNYIIITNNGTIPIQIALKTLSIKGEVVTTPFSYVATTSSIVWENLKPVFVDIDPSHLTIDETLIENAITEKTTAILATHVFGNPCNIPIINSIAKKYSLKVIYDAAHAFGVTFNNKSIFNYGDVSTCSFHATKLFHTGEGGALFCSNKKLYDKLFYHHNFGHDGPEKFHGLGINAKISELQAAMGLAVLPYIDDIIAKRKEIIDFYTQNLHKKDLQFIKIRKDTNWNYAYFPVIFSNESLLLHIVQKLNEKNIFPRRYFFPSLNNLPYIKNKQKMPISESISKRVLCLPLYNDLNTKDLTLICNIINDNLT